MPDYSFLRKLAAAAVIFAAACGTVAGAAGEPADFAVSVQGQGRPVIFIPGIATPGEVWQPTVNALAANCQCHVLTLAGFGGLKPSGSEPFLPRVRDEIIQYIRDRKLDRPVIVGHSMGGVMALWIAETAPELPGRLVVVDALPHMAGIIYPTATEKDLHTLIARNVAEIQKATAAEFTERQRRMITQWVTSREEAEKLVLVTSRSDPPTVGRAVGELMNADLYPKLGNLKCPVLVMVSLADKVGHSTKEKIVATFQQQFEPLRGVRFEFFERAKHFIMVDDLAGFVKTLNAELAADAPAPKPAN